MLNILCRRFLYIQLVYLPVYTTTVWRKKLHAITTRNKPRKYHTVEYFENPKSTITNPRQTQSIPIAQIYMTDHSPGLAQALQLRVTELN